MAVTYDVTPATHNGTSVRGNNAVGTLESTAQVVMYKITVKDDSDTAVNLQINDGVNGSLYDLILREVSPMIAWAPADTTGVINVVMDGHHNSAASLQSRIRQLASATPANNDSTVEAAVSFTVAV
jgi:hypothetical protein